MTLSRALRILLLLAAAAVVVMCVGVATSSMFLPFELLLSTAFIGLVSLSVAMACAMVRDAGHMPRRMISGVIVSLATGGVWIVLYLTDLADEVPDVAAVPFVAGASWAGLMAFVGLLALPKQRATWWCILRRVSVACLWTLAGAFVIGTILLPDVSPFWALFGFRNGNEMEEVLVRMGTGLSLIVGGLVATTFLTMWLTPPIVSDAVRLPITLRCPRCEHHHARQTGEDRCGGCGLRIRVLVS